MVATRPGTVPPFAALTTIAAVMGSQNAPVKARSQSAWTDCLRVQQSVK